MRTRDAESNPKYKRICDDLKSSILAGDYSHGDRLPTEAQLVERFGASRSTIIRALRELEHLGLLQRKQGSGSYATPNASTGRNLFGLIVPGVVPEQRMHSIFPMLYDEMAAISHDHGAGLLFGSRIESTDDPIGRFAGVADQMLAHKVTGVFLVPQGLSQVGRELNERMTRVLAEKSVPIILLDRDIVDFPRRSNLDLVGVDNHRGGFLLAEHLIKRGCRRLAFVGANTAPTVTGRIAGCETAMRDRDVNFDAAWIARGDHESPDFARDLVKRRKPDAVICSHDAVAAVLMRHLLAMGVRIPDDVKIVGFDDTPIASLLPVPLTTIRQPTAALARTAVRFMLDRLESPDLPERQVLIGCQLVVRESSGGASAAS